MHKLRVAAAATVIALLAAFASMGSASAASNGVGTTETATSLVDVALGNAGSLLHLRVLGDDAKSTVDPAVGPTSALTQMFAVKATSSVVSILNNISIPNPVWQAVANSSKTSDTNTPTGLNLANAIPTPSVAGLGANLLGGSLVPGALTASITDGVAKSGLNASLANLGLVSGIISANSVASQLASAAGPTAADANRGINVDAVSVLNLGSLLRGLGIDPANLPVSSVTSILDTLQIPAAGLPVGDLASTVAGLNTTISDLLTQITGGASIFGDLTGALPVSLNGLGLPVAGGATAIPNPTDLNAVLGQVKTLLSSVLSTALGALDNITLLKFNGLNIGAVTHAVSDSKASKADVVGTLGSTSIGGLTIPGLDLGSTLSTVTGVLDQITGTLDSVLGAISPSLTGLLQVKFFDKYSNNGVTQSGGYTKALAGITGVHIGIHPPTDLLNIVGSLLPTNGIGSAITANNSAASIPVVGGLMNSLTGQLVQGGATGLLGALTGGADIKVADVSAGSNFAVPGTSNPTSVSQLPRTGANTAAFLVIGMLMVGGVIVGRRYIPVLMHTEK